MTDQPSSPNIDNRISVFIANNPEVTIKQKKDFQELCNPWGDETVLLRIDDESKNMLALLPNLRFPPRFSAIWHLDTRDLEFIFAPLPKKSIYIHRSFIFRYDNEDYKCEFGNATNAVKEIAKASYPSDAPTSPTSYRNLARIDNFLRQERSSREKNGASELIVASFFIRNVQCDEDKLVSLARHLNFYMKYFDRSSPIILIHESPVIESQTENPIQFLYGDFPSKITGIPIDPYLLSLWESTNNTTIPVVVSFIISKL